MPLPPRALTDPPPRPPTSSVHSRPPTLFTPCDTGPEEQHQRSVEWLQYAGEGAVDRDPGIQLDVIMRVLCDPGAEDDRVVVPSRLP